MSGSCGYCFAAISPRSRICEDCKKLRHKVLQRCKGAMTRAHASGKLERLFTGKQKCVDCGGSASVWDHRDYRKPLDVSPVCDSCNHVRGQGAFDDSHIHLLDRKSTQGGKKKRNVSQSPRRPSRKKPNITREQKAAMLWALNQ